MIISTDGTAFQRLCCAGADSNAEDWAPDGSRLVFQELVCSPSCVSTRVDTIHADGTGFATVHGAAADPAWSPDGTRIVYDNTADGDQEIYLMNPDGTGDLRLTDNTVTDQQPAWQPTLAGPSYPRPKGATPLKTYLVVAYQPCAASNRTHGPPLGFPSCAPRQRSWLTFERAGSCSRSSRTSAVRSRASRRS